jgi:hypothetical protein
LAKDNFNIRKAVMNTFFDLTSDHYQKLVRQSDLYLQDTKDIKEWSYAPSKLKQDGGEKMKVEEAIYNICKSVDDSKMEIVKALKSVLKRLEEE